MTAMNSLIVNEVLRVQDPDAQASWTGPAG